MKLSKGNQSYLDYEVTEVVEVVEPIAVVEPVAVAEVLEPMPPKIARTVPKRTALNVSLTTGQCLVYNYLVDGWTVAEIASELQVTQSNIKFHKTAMYKKLQLNGIAALLARELRYYKSLQCS